MCVATMWATAIAVLVYWITGVPWVLLLFAPASVAWGVAAWSFGKLCHFRFGWLTVLGWFHLAGLLLLGIVVGVGAAILYVNRTIPDKWKVAMYILYGLLMAFGPFVGRRLRKSSYKGIYGIAKDKLALLCRQTALSLARHTKAI